MPISIWPTLSKDSAQYCSELWDALALHCSHTPPACTVQKASGRATIFFKFWRLWKHFGCFNWKLFKSLCKFGPFLPLQPTPSESCAVHYTADSQRRQKEQGRKNFRHLYSHRPTIPNTKSTCSFSYSSGSKVDKRQPPVLDGPTIWSGPECR